ERYEITVSVIDGTVYLYGDVDSYFEKAQADDVASGAAGVMSVDNNLNVQADYEPYSYEPYVDDWYTYDYNWYDYEAPPVKKPDWEIKEEIESQLWWSPFVDSDDVNVSVDDGTATLTGTVESWSEYWAARENAFDGGAVWVDNDLKVE
ncbi:MAG: BON domain-containing protein, partial [Candidatus Hydrogenedentota bacterium]